MMPTYPPAMVLLVLCLFLVFLGSQLLCFMWSHTTLFVVLHHRSWLTHTEGEVIDASIVYDPWTRESRGFGFVTMAATKEADHCIKYLDCSVLQGQVIIVEKRTFYCFVFTTENPRLPPIASTSTRSCLTATTSRLMPSSWIDSPRSRSALVLLYSTHVISGILCISVFTDETTIFVFNESVELNCKNRNCSILFECTNRTQRN
ncbi:Serine/arginine-rich splicing factor SR45a [Zea mays]|uniref:Serine/arginine-rich splicing factor SR45a n=1 Tax=Zea mays TaxID=4577 RepID=A0A3L6DRV8_MAIZE|nr:Serine/arginine-rich splicing factor SR45a [Zea mays]